MAAISLDVAWRLWAGEFEKELLAVTGADADSGGRRAKPARLRWCSVLPRASLHKPSPLKSRGAKWLMGAVTEALWVCSLPGRAMEAGACLRQLAGDPPRCVADCEGVQQFWRSCRSGVGALLDAAGRGDADEDEWRALREPLELDCQELRALASQLEAEEDAEAEPAWRE